MTINRRRPEAALNGLIETLAANEHVRWSHWQHYLHNQGTRQIDGSLLIPAESVVHWAQLISTPYEELTESEKESDREQVRIYLRIIIDNLLKEGKL